MATRAEVAGTQIVGLPFAAMPRRHRVVIRLRIFPIVVIAVGLLVAAALATGRGDLLRLAFPAAAVLGSATILWRERTAWIGFAWWIWMLSPFVRRLSDMQAGWNATNPITLAPMLVTLMIVPSLVRRLPSFRHRTLMPFVLMAAALAYGGTVGAIRATPAAAVYAAATWLCPLLIGAWLVQNWRAYPWHRAILGQTLLWGLIIIGIYGVYQFVHPPEWDRYWMVQAGMDSIGRPVPYRVRVFSMLNAPGPFACVVEAALLLTLAVRSRGRTVALVVGAAALLLSLVRSAWLGIVFGAILYFVYAPWRKPGRAMLRAFATIAALCVIGYAASWLVPIDRIRDATGERLVTLRDIRGDHSFLERRHDLAGHLANVGQDVVGEGLGSTGTSVALDRSVGGIRDFDNGVLEIFYALGWPGGILFVAGIGWLVVPMIRKGDERFDDFARAARAASIAILFQAAFGNVFANVSGAILWTCIGVFVAARRWAHNELHLEGARP